PWNHGQWNSIGSSLGPFQFGSDTSLYYRQQIEKKWFAHWLQGKGSADFPEPEWPVWLVQDQHFVDHRPDVLTFATEPLMENLTITGDVAAELFASTSGTDSDWVVKLIDVCPADATYNTATRQPMAEFQLMLNAEIVRARFRESMREPKPVPSLEPLEYTIDLHANDHVFRKKHRIMVQVQSTWFPVYDRNPQSFVPNIFKAGTDDYQKATQRLYHSPERPSAIVLPLNSGSSVPDDAPDSCYLPIKIKLQQKISTATLDSYTGTYQAPGFSRFTIAWDGDQLSLEFAAEKFPLLPISETDFYVTELNLELNF